MIAHVHQSTICSQKVKSSYPKNPGPQTQTHRVSRAQTPAMQSPTPAMESPRIVRVYYPQRRPGGPHFSSFLAKKYHRTRDKKRCYLTKSSLSDSLLTFIESFSYPLDLLSFHFCFSKHSSFRLQIASPSQSPFWSSSPFCSSRLSRTANNALCSAHHYRSTGRRFVRPSISTTFAGSFHPMSRRVAWAAIRQPTSCNSG